jgi:HAE1 family hydrophobic/amphiphilic exporter-1
LVVVGGLLFSQLVTLYLTPVFYIYMSAAQEKVRSWKSGKKKHVHTEAPVAG